MVTDFSLHSVSLKMTRKGKREYIKKTKQGQPHTANIHNQRAKTHHSVCVRDPSLRSSKIFYDFRLRHGLDDKEGEARTALHTTNTNERSNVESKRIKVRPHFFTVKRREWDGTLKRKSCLSVASSFSLVESPTGVGKKVQTANFFRASPQQLVFASFLFFVEKK